MITNNLDQINMTPDTVYFNQIYRTTDKTCIDQLNMATGTIYFDQIYRSTNIRERNQIHANVNSANNLSVNVIRASLISEV